MKNKLYTAVGRTQVKGNLNGQRCPVVILNNKEYILDLQEMMLWAVLNWRILTVNEAKELYEAKEKEVGYLSRRDFEECLYRLVQRGLIAEGIGETDADALYDLLSELYIIPISENILLRAISFVRLTFFSKVKYSVTKQVFGKDKRTDDEKKVMRLAKQALLSTAEIIKCVECNTLDFGSEEQLMDTLYHDDITTSDNIAETTRNLSNCRPILISVANLYLRRQIILERL